MHGGRVWVEDRLDGEPGRPLRHRAAGHEPTSPSWPIDRRDADSRERAARSLRGRRRRRARASRLRDPARRGAARHPGRRAGPARPGRRRRRRGDGSSRIFLVAERRRAASGCCAPCCATSTADADGGARGAVQRAQRRGGRGRARHGACPTDARPARRPRPVAGTLQRRRVAGDPRPAAAPALRPRRRPDRVHGQRARRRRDGAPARRRRGPRALARRRASCRPGRCTRLRLPGPRRVDASRRYPADPEPTTVVRGRDGRPRR